MMYQSTHREARCKDLDAWKNSGNNNRPFKLETKVQIGRDDENKQHDSHSQPVQIY